MNFKIMWHHMSSESSFTTQALSMLNVFSLKTKFLNCSFKIQISHKVVLKQCQRQNSKRLLLLHVSEFICINLTCCLWAFPVLCKASTAKKSDSEEIHQQSACNGLIESVL